MSHSLQVVQTFLGLAERTVQELAERTVQAKGQLSIESSHKLYQGIEIACFGLACTRHFRPQQTVLAIPHANRGHWHAPAAAFVAVFLPSVQYRFLHDSEYQHVGTSSRNTADRIVEHLFCCCYTFHTVIGRNIDNDGVCKAQTCRMRLGTACSQSTFDLEPNPGLLLSLGPSWFEIEGLHSARHRYMEVRSYSFVGQSH
jgi:hypothetical protein